MMQYRIRRPKTYQEIRQAVHTRPCRRKLPTSYDDLMRTLLRSWKAYRKTQYRAQL